LAFASPVTFGACCAAHHGSTARSHRLFLASLAQLRDDTEQSRHEFVHAPARHRLPHAFLPLCAPPKQLQASAMSSTTPPSSKCIAPRPRNLLHFSQFPIPPRTPRKLRKPPLPQILALLLLFLRFLAQEPSSQPP